MPQELNAAKGETKQKKPRIAEVDVLRGAAVLLMASFHLAFDLAAYFSVPLQIYSGAWYWIGRISAVMFMFIAGVASTLGTRAIRRGLIVLAAALLVTLVSIPTMGENYIRFGILHFFGTLMILKGLADKIFKTWRARLVAACVFALASWWLGIIVRGAPSVGTPLLLAIGLTYEGFSSFDYYPLFPSAAYFCLGIAAGLVVYRRKRSLLRMDISQRQQSIAKEVVRTVLRPFAFLGRHSLVVYLVHQPLILGVLFLLSFAGLL